MIRASAVDNDANDFDRNRQRFDSLVNFFHSPFCQQPKFCLKIGAN